MCRFDSFTYPPPLANQSHVLTSCIYLILCSYKLLLDDLTQAVLFFAQSHNSVCKVGNKIKNKKSDEPNERTHLLRSDYGTNPPNFSASESAAWGVSLVIWIYSGSSGSSGWNIYFCSECLFWAAPWNSCTLPGDAHGRHINFFFFAVKTTEVSFPLWCIRGGCKLSSWAVTLLAVSFPSVSRPICIQDAAPHPDMNHWATCILEKPIL